MWTKLCVFGRHLPNKQTLVQVSQCILNGLNIFSLWTAVYNASQSNCKTLIRTFSQPDAFTHVAAAFY